MNALTGRAKCIGLSGSCLLACVLRPNFMDASHVVQGIFKLTPINFAFIMLINRLKIVALFV